MGGRSGRGIGSRSPIGYASGYQNSYSHAEITPLAFSRPRCEFNSHRGGQYRETIIGRGLPDAASPDDGFPISPLPDTRFAVVGIGHRGTPISGIGHRGGSIAGRVSSGGVNIGNGTIGAD